MMEAQNFKGTPRQVADDMAAQVPKNFQEAFARVVKAGMRVMFSDQTHDLMLQQLEQEGDFGENVGKAIAGLMLLLFEKSNKTMPQEVIIPSGVYLLGEGGDFIEKVTGQEITPEVTARAMQVMMDTLMEKFGIDPKRMYEASAKAAQGGYKNG
jgi:hypothetical protein